MKKIYCEIMVLDLVHSLGVYKYRAIAFDFEMDDAMLLEPPSFGECLGRTREEAKLKMKIKVKTWAENNNFIFD